MRSVERTSATERTVVGIAGSARRAATPTTRMAWLRVDACIRSHTRLQHEGGAPTYRRVLDDYVRNGCGIHLKTANSA
jgi:hypothetical protein